MSLREAIEAEQTNHRGPVCGVKLVLAGLNDIDRSDLQAAIDDDTIPAVTIARALAKPPHDVRLPDFTITRHRRNDCGCGRTS